MFANAADRRGKLIPLHYAAWVGNAEVVRVLLGAKAGRRAKDERDRTPLDLAKERKHPAVVKLLEGSDCPAGRSHAAPSSSRG